MRLFLAGATGVIGIRLLPLVVSDGHTVAGMTRSSEKAQLVESLRGQPVVCDVFDAEALRGAVVSVEPDAVMNQLTDLPDDASQLEEFYDGNDRIRGEGTRNLLDAAAAAGVKRFYSQSIAWDLPGDAQSIAWDLPGERGERTKAFERSVVDAGGVVVRYGQLYGPDTFLRSDLPQPPRIEVGEAARRTVPLLDAEPGIVEVVE